MCQPAAAEPCLHCERQPASHYVGLCATCASSIGIRQCYVKRRHWTPEWEAHLRRLTERASRGLPLFPEPPSPETSP
jgi:hypothetical protein